MRNAADLCDLAADLIDQRGWRRGEADVDEPNGPVCVRDALQLAARQLGTASGFAERAVEDEAETVSPQWPRRWARIDLWNDLYAASEDQATMVLRAAAKKLRERGN